MQGQRNLNDLHLNGALAPMFWVFEHFGTRQGYTKLVVWAMSVTLVQSLAYYLHGHPYMALVPLVLTGAAGFILNESYKTDRAPVDPFLGFFIAILWTCSAFTAITGHSDILAYLLSILMGSILSIVVIWSWFVYHIGIDVNHFLTVDEEE